MRIAVKALLLGLGIAAFVLAFPYIPSKVLKGIAAVILGAYAYYVIVWPAARRTGE